MSEDPIRDEELKQIELDKLAALVEIANWLDEIAHSIKKIETHLCGND